ncbi:unnamed protein product, partial [Staurois parvus]
MQGPGRADIVNAGSGETGYSECRVQEDWRYRRPDIVNAGFQGKTKYQYRETAYSECRAHGE